jgi:hypothetical protein
MEKLGREFESVSRGKAYDEVMKLQTFLEEQRGHEAF